MDKFIFHLAFAIGFLIPVMGWSQENIFHFEDELCQYQGKFEVNKYTEQQLQDTYKLVVGYFNIYTDQELDLDENYKSTRTDVENLKIVKVRYFEKLKDSLLNFLDLTYKVKKAEFAARNGDMSALITLYQNNSLVKYYSHALFNGGEELLKAYEYLVKNQMKNNSLPDRLWSEYQANIKSDNAQSLAFDKVITYGWWNNVNNELPHINYDGTQFKQFIALFTLVETIDCDEI